MEDQNQSPKQIVVEEETMMAEEIQETWWNPQRNPAHYLIAFIVLGIVIGYLIKYGLPADYNFFDAINQGVK